MKKVEKEISSVDVLFERKSLPPSYDVAIVYSNGAETTEINLSASEILSKYAANLKESDRKSYEAQAVLDANCALPARLFQQPRKQKHSDTTEANERCRCVIS